MDYITAQGFVKEVLESIPRPWGADILDQVFLAIENNPIWLETYQKMIQAHSRYMVENSIGFNVMGLAGMKSLDRVHKARSRLIENYTELAPETTEA